MEFGLKQLIKVRNLLSDRNRWTKWDYAISWSGNSVLDPGDPDAYAFCLLGAAQRVASEENEEYDKKKVLESFSQLFNLSWTSNDVAKFNDNHTHEEILSLLDSRINELQTLLKAEHILRESAHEVISV